MYRFETLRSEATGEFYFRFKAPNNEIMFQSEGYQHERSRDEAIETIIREIRHGDVGVEPA